jgi:hypothetical protein
VVHGRGNAVAAGGAGAFEADARFQPLEPLAGSFSIDWGRLPGECVPEYGDDADRQLRKLRQVV